MVRSWVKLIWNSVGGAAIAAAAQVGVAEALGIVRWGDSFASGGPGAWNAQLSWIGFIYATSVVGGAAVGRRAVPGRTRIDRTGANLTATISTAVGAGLAVAIAWLPARDARPPVNVDPELVISITAGAGIIVGLVVAFAALYSRSVTRGILAAVAWIWLVGIGSAVAGIETGKPYDPPRLAVVDAPSVMPTTWWSGPNLMIAVAGALGITVAALARRRGARRLGIAVCGLVGPAVVAAAYLIAGPGPDRSYQAEPYTAALIAAGVGLLASVVVALPSGSGAAAPSRRGVGTSSGRGDPASGGRDRASRPIDGRVPYPADDEPIIGEIIDAPTSPQRANAGPGGTAGPRRSHEEDYSDWIRDLGRVPGQRTDD